MLRLPAADARQLGLARAWREPPAVATSVPLRIGAAFFGFGGLVVVICAPLLHGTGAMTGALIGTAVLISAMGCLYAVLGLRLPRWCFGALLVVAIGGITVMARTTPHPMTALAVTSCFLVPMVAAATLLSLRTGLMLVALALICRTWVLASGGTSTAGIVVLEGCTLGMVGVVAWLARAADAAAQDPLTGLLNRRGFGRRLEHELARLEREGGQCALVALDIDDFKHINDAAGHAQGDRLIVECATTWRAMLPEGAVLGRYGGDAFVLALPDLPLGTAADLTDRLRAAAGEGVTVSAGVAAWQRGDSGSMLLNRADVALYDAKASGRDRTIVYGDPCREASDLETAIVNRELRLLLQPVVALPSGEPVGFESLVRWERPGRGTVAPLDFVPHAERTGAIHSLGRWVLEECCRLAMTLPGPRRSIGVNVSVHELRRSGYAAGVRRLLEQWQMPGNLLVLEVTESVFEDGDPQIIENLHDLRALGALVAIDDFGAGYSSLRRIEQLPIDIIKIDGALVSPIRPGRDTPILRAVATMGRSLGVRLVAEHVESEYQAEVLHGLGYHLAQGFLFGRPCAPGDAVLIRPRAVPPA